MKKGKAETLESKLGMEEQNILEVLHKRFQNDSNLKSREDLIDDIKNIIQLAEDDVLPASIKQELNEIDAEKLDDLSTENISTIWGNASKAVELSMSFMEKSIDAANRDFESVARATPNPSTDFSSELNNIDFAKLIGGPMQAAVKAQADASLSTINFIKEVGFDKDGDGNPTSVRYVDFLYDENPGEVDENGAPVPPQSKKIRVPLLTMLTVPSLRIETLDIDFNVKLNSVESKDVSSSLGVNFEGSGGFGPVKLKVSAAYKRSSSYGVKVEKEYSMNVKVKATQDELPAGLEKVLNLLSN